MHRLFGFTASAVALLAACSAPPSSTTDTLTVNAIVSLSGTRADVGRGNAMSAAVEFVNSLKKLPNLQLALRLNDSESVEARATELATQLRDEKAVPVIFTASSDTSIPVLRDVAIPSHLFVFATGTSSPTLTRDYAPIADGYFVRTSPSSDVAAAALAKLAYADGVRHLGIIYGDDSFGTSYRADLVKAFTALGGTVSAEQAIPAGNVAPSYATQLAVARGGADTVNGKPAVAVAVGAQVMKTLLRDAAAAQVAVQWYAAHTARSQEIFSGGNATQAEGMKGVSPRSGTAENFAVYREQFAAVSALDPNGTWYPHIFDAMMVYALSVARGARTADDFKATVRHVSNPGPGVETYGLTAIGDAFDAALAGRDIDYQGASGPVDFDANGDIAGGYLQFHVSAGSFIDDQPLP